MNRFSSFIRSYLAYWSFKEAMHRKCPVCGEYDLLTFKLEKSHGHGVICSTCMYSTIEKAREESL
jgi:ssDNA-binding Zn-finger/Zn-ribbon topoisomerase 1